MEGRVQRARKVVSAPGDAKEDWKIIRALSDVLGKSLSYATLHDLRQEMIKENGVFGELDQLFTHEWTSVGVEGKLNKAAFTGSVRNYYQTNVVARASKTMAECTHTFIENQNTKRKKA